MTRMLAVGGPTATGKTVLAVELARLVGAELLNADSRQVGRRLVVGTARPTQAELGGVPCHLLDLCEPGAAFTVADWLREARTVVDRAAERETPLIAVGGTGQYLRALREGWVFGGAAPDAELRARLSARAQSPGGLAELVVELRALDPEGAASLDLANPRRVIRALELLSAGVQSLAAARQRAGGVDVDLVVLDAEGALHRTAIEARVAAMFDGGAILDETRAELDRGVERSRLARAGIGYAEAIDVIDGARSIQDARARALLRTTRYVKAQRTWFRQEPATLRLVRTEGMTTSSLAGTVLDAVRAGHAPTR